MLEVIGLEKAFTGDGTAVRAVDGVDFSVEKNESFTLLGASGCGKTTTLRCIAGLEKPSAGIIRIDGREVFNAEKRVFVPPDKRGIGMVFQSYAIWPHMNVFGNAAFPLRIARVKRAEIDERVRWALNMVRLGDLVDRPATKLSGGQQQRLAVARALVQEPKLLLLDEPLSNLDAKLREQMRLELKALQSRLGLTMLYVTHDQTEAIVLSDHIAIMREGRIVQRGSPREVYMAPKSEFVADFVGSTNLIHGTVVECLGPTCCRVETPQGAVLATSTGEISPGQSVVVSVRPENIHLRAEAPEELDDGTVWEVAIHDHVFLGDATYYAVRWGDRVLRVRSSPHLDIAKGDRAYVRMIARDCVCVPHTEELHGDR